MEAKWEVRFGDKWIVTVPDPMPGDMREMAALAWCEKRPNRFFMDGKLIFELEGRTGNVG